MLCIARSAVAVLLVAVRSVLASGPNCKISILNDFKRPTTVIPYYLQRAQYDGPDCDGNTYSFEFDSFEYQNVACTLIDGSTSFTLSGTTGKFVVTCRDVLLSGLKPGPVAVVYKAPTGAPYGPQVYQFYWDCPIGADSGPNAPVCVCGPGLTSVFGNNGRLASCQGPSGTGLQSDPCSANDGTATGQSDFCKSDQCYLGQCTAPATAKPLKRGRGAGGVNAWFDQQVAASPCGQLAACPVVPHGYECVDTRTDIEQCGGCTGHRGGTGADCTLIEHARDVRCFDGRCRVAACEDGFFAASDACVALH